ncbi:MAG: hypothetical protein ABIS45_09165 [Burkholderiales bacterium]
MKIAVLDDRLRLSQTLGRNISAWSQNLTAEKAVEADGDPLNGS